MSSLENLRWSHIIFTIYGSIFIPMTEYLFTYGLLRKGADHAMSEYLSKHAQFISEGTFRGKLYLIDYYPGAIPSRQEEDRVIGDIFKLNDENFFMVLDRFEGIGSQFSEPTEYVREQREIKREDQSKIKAWIYLYNWDVTNQISIPSGDFLAYGN